MEKKPRAQGILDFILTFVAILALFIGLVRIAVWFHANYARRQVAFQVGRLYAGNITTYEGRATPVLVGQSSICPSGDCYNPIDLTAEWVFGGKTGGEVVGAVGGATQLDFELIKEQCRANYQEACSGYDVFEECPSYVQCMCENYHLETIMSMYEGVIAQNNQAIPQLRSGANSLRESADNCDDPWEGCWWAGGFGKTARQLRDAAGDMDRQANEMLLQNYKLQASIDKLKKCCDVTLHPTLSSQNTCIANSEKQNCAEVASAYAQLWQGRVTILQTDITNITAMQAAAIAWIPPCDTLADSSQTASSCAAECTLDPPLPADLYDTCVSECIERVRNECCQGFSDPNYGAASGRNCRDPASSCDGQGLPKCGLEAFANSTLVNAIATKNTQVGYLTSAVNSVNSCCGGNDYDAQVSCINAAIQTAANGYKE